MISEITKIVDAAITEILSTLSSDAAATDFKNEKIILFGNTGLLDSISLVSLIVSIEERIQSELNLDILLVNEKAMSQLNSPFRTYHSLTNYIFSLVQ